MTPSLTPRLGGALFLALIGSAAAADASLDAGRALFNETAQPQCALCHSLKDAGAEGEIGPNLDDFKPTVEQVRAAVTSGIGIMPGFAETLTDAEIETLSTYVATVAGGSDAAANSDASAPTEDAAAAETDTPGAEILAQGDPAAGEKVFRKCKACHTVEEDGPNRVGPNLYGIVGASVAAVDGFRYSGALTDHGGDWTPDRLAAFLANPRKAVPGTKMSFAGLRKSEDQADVIAYLASLSDAD
ncbi:MAG: c-type cytochrome [Sulfitobacter sp.]|uniref:SorU family sulfite dehydrogenase c-type cytochrome subunit n=1 Tax=Sulfitobacter TaxID=60136 RepID=UPI000066AB8F|nr:MULTISPECIES: c-type cytochrome [unclassified Sulfitobacter]AXI52762.1 cytochrome C552 [Sulfitobacter sp. SK025]EAP79674.1 cytochrome c552 [Sulfitobacter sp. NAS-14.1]MCP3878681.1 c-type cytochrome [Sulfitobacter sp.]